MGIIKNQLSSIENSDGGAIQSANEVINKIIAAVNGLANHVDNTLDVGALSNSSTNASQLSDKTSVESMIKGIKEIVEITSKSGVNPQRGNADFVVEAGAATSVINGGTEYNHQNGGGGVGDGSEFLNKVSDADEWAMIDSITKATTATGSITNKSDNNAGELITGTTSGNKGAGAKNEADFAAAVALKAMSKTGTFSKNDNSTYIDNLKKGSAVAVNKVLRAIDVMIMQTLQNELGKIKNNIKKD